MKIKNRIRIHKNDVDPQTLLAIKQLSSYRYSHVLKGWSHEIFEICK